ncbi:diacylglycerol/lipid kinase family protein [Capillimicrobium parvum]|uniref:Lipid kinase YegS n=1 Tax=Capillimicrobium parvum TaxID=2884022 RepID=A0A9E7C660_9ACTN|nr:diacylglycerol kinase family protein [Capillimicrobium parvum]UGS38653.1 lipid kinase YegS [Capillimicrobium parvum]
MTRRRLAAAAALALPVLAAALATAITIARVPGLRILAVALLLLAIVVGWRGLLHTGLARWLQLAAAAAMLVGAAALLPWGEPLLLLGDVLVILALAGGVAAAHEAFRIHVPLPTATAPRRPVLVWNPRSGDGSAVRHNLAAEAQARGIEPIELRPGNDLRDLVLEAIERGADAVAAAGGDGTQAVVAEIAVERGLPFACIPAGTRNHFALDLGVDREDVVGALDAFVDGGERRVDLPLVNGHTFVNNVSLGVYAEAVAQSGYRAAKKRTLLRTLPEAGDMDLVWTGPHGHRHSGGVAILVSNNRYRLGMLEGGTRPRIDEGLLGVTVLGEPTQIGEGLHPLQRPWRQWSAAEFEVGASAPVPTGIDGESVLLEPPLRFSVRPRALRVRISRHHPGASPSAGIPDGLPNMARELVRIAAGHEPVALAPSTESDAPAVTRA